MMRFGQPRSVGPAPGSAAAGRAKAVSAPAIAFLCGLAMLAAATFEPQAAAAKPIRIVAFGDSLTAGYQLPDADGFAPKLQKALRQKGYDVSVVNGGVSGDTTTGGLARLDWTLGQGTDAVILELGANDMLRGIDPAVPEKTPAAMIDVLKAKRIRVLLAGMRAAPSLGADYAKRFDAIYPALAKRDAVAFYPFFLQGIMGDAGQHLADGLHPNARGVDTIVAGILPSVEALLKGLDGRS